MTFKDLANLLAKDKDFKQFSTEINNTPVPNVPLVTALGAVDYLITNIELDSFPTETLIKYINYYLYIELLILKIIDKTKSPDVYHGASGIDYKVGKYINTGWPSISFMPVNDPNNNWMNIAFVGPDLSVCKNYVYYTNYKDMPCILKNTITGEVSLPKHVVSVKREDAEELL